MEFRVWHWYCIVITIAIHLTPLTSAQNVPPLCRDGSNQTIGVCYTQEICGQKQGIVLLEFACENGDSCCKFERVGESDPVYISEYLTHVIPPAERPSLAKFIVPKEEETCQIRVDFVDVSISGSPNGGIHSGDCVNDSISVTGSFTLQKDITVCGELTGQHMYLSFINETTTPIELSVDLKTSAAYHLKITKIPCNSTSLVPPDCLQFYVERDEEKKIIKSFNYPHQQLNNQYYTICIRPWSSRNGYRDCKADDGDLTPKFSVSDSEVFGALRGDECPNDWVKAEASGEKRCGTKFTPTTIPGGPTPRRFIVHFNEDEKNDAIIISNVKTNGTLNPGGRCLVNDGRTFDFFCHPIHPIDGYCLCTEGTSHLSDPAPIMVSGLEPKDGLTYSSIPGYYCSTSVVDPPGTFRCSRNVRKLDAGNHGFCLEYYSY